MRIAIFCQTCALEDAGGNTPFSYVSLNEEGIYRSVCPVGHDMVVTLQQMKFEVLAETAVQAIIDGYYRDAVTSFSASLERFYEYYCKCVMMTRDVEEAEIDHVWKLVVSQSERQLGMFIAWFTMENSRKPQLLPQKSANSGSVEFRNKVVHKGYIPSEIEAVQFGQAVIDLVESITQAMRATYGAAMDRIVLKHQMEVGTRLKEADHQRHSCMFWPMVYRLIPTHREHMNLADELEARRKQRARRSE